MNRWIKDFFSNNAWALLMMIAGLIATTAVMRADVASSLSQIREISPEVRALRVKSEVQDEKNKKIEETLVRIETKLDKVLISK